MTVRCDIFCTVIDNFGDIGIAWRLARQLATEHGLAVRLWVDDLDSFQRIRPEVDPGAVRQSLTGVEICRWTDPLPDVTPADIVIEALACHLPDIYEQAMAAMADKPLWLNLEYLSAEDWVVGCHTLPSPHPRLPLIKYFFMPGYLAGTGGVLMEHDLPARRRAFQADPVARTEFWRGLTLPPPGHGEIRASLFCYESSALATLLDAWSVHPAPVTCLLPAGKALAGAAAYFDRHPLNPGDSVTRGALTLHVLPMLDQDAYDRLLCACDVNFVRGEDSFTRAQWAGQPMVWQAYRQADDIHLDKLAAFLKHYRPGLTESAACALDTLWQAWNRDQDVSAAWPAYWQHRSEYLSHAAEWQARLSRVGDLAGNLMKFSNEKLRLKS
ncbi:MAG: elongation factor P maturation arginine rhamnosyltransferase EarP [Pseudomonadota bacterium]